MTKLKNCILKSIKDGKMACWQCKRPIILDNIVFIDLDNRQVGYSCACGNDRGMRSFESVGLDFNAGDLDEADMASPFQIVANGTVVNPRLPGFLDFMSSMFGGGASPFSPGPAARMKPPAKVVKVAKIDAKKGGVDLDVLNLDPVYKESLLADLDAVGEEEFWKGMRQSAAMSQKSLPDFIAGCEKDFVKLNNRPVRKK